MMEYAGNQQPKYGAVSPRFENQVVEMGVAPLTITASEHFAFHPPS